MTITLSTPPESTALTLLSTVKDEQGISGSTYDAVLQRMIDQASETIYAWAGRPLYRAQFRERRRGNGRGRIVLGRAPVALIGTVSFTTTSISDVVIDVAESGILSRPGGFGSAYLANEWSFEYHAGYFLPGDDFSGVITATSSDNSYNSTGFHPLLVAGDIVLASGFANAENNGRKVVTSATTSKIIVDDSLTDESLTATLTLHNVPGWLERAAIDLVSMAFSARDRDGSLESERIGDASATYAVGSDSAASRIRSMVMARFASFQ